MFSALKEAFYHEVNSIKNSWYKLFLITLLPLISFSIIIAIFYAGVARDLPVVVVDNDQSELSRQIIKDIDATSTIEVKYKVNSASQAIDLVKKSKAYAVIVIPNNFSKDTLLQKKPNVTTMVNTQYILIGKILTSALTSTIMQSSGKVEYVKSLVDSQNPHSSINSIAPIGMQITPFFNTYKNYYFFLVSALLPAIWQIFIVISTLVSVGLMFKYNRQKEFFKNQEHIGAKLIGLLLPYTIAYMILGLIYLFYIYSSWEFQGSILVLIFGMFLTIVAYQGMALLLFISNFDYARSLSLGAVYTAPAFAFLGITFPMYNMNNFALFWRDLLPVSHYTQIQISQGNYGVDPYMEIGKLLTIACFWIVFIPVLLAFKKRMKKEFS
ncbi:ABC-type multidrug transport system, permease component [hydrothermal vent metagenome]|uniref:ABC-type multidrug transport system, permease component n=1 Tax=hydrothermal vent metagenome TaxID=652676 RepID=A0A1W1EFK9_9ZZZZ